MKKRLFSGILAAVMLFVATNLACATPCKYDRPSNGSLAYPEGHWNAPLTYTQDGEYGNTVAPYNRSDPNYQTRHVSMFNSCSSTSMSYYSGSTTWRGVGFTTENHTDTTSQQYPPSGDIQYVNLPDPSLAPLTIYHAGCGGSRANGSWAEFDTVNDGDHRMIFRNYYNTDFTSYNGAHNNGPFTGKEGLNIKEYDYLEFDLHIAKATQWKRSRNVNPSKGYAVYLYYETNDANGYYLNYAGVTDAAHGNVEWGLDGHPAIWSFEDQLHFNSNDELTDVDSWITIRMEIPDTIKNSPTPPTVKQVTIRMMGGTKAITNGILVDDVRFIKNDDHAGVVYPNTTGPNGVSYSAKEYPAGKYFMINDFEYENYNQESTAQVGVVFPYRHTDDNGKTYTHPTYTIVGRYEDIRLNDKFNSYDKTDHQWARGDKNKNDPPTDFFMSAPGQSVTQGDFATALNVRNRKVYMEGGAGWKIPVYYQRKYTNAIDLSQYTHFAIDVYVRTVGHNGLCRPNGSTAKGVTFNIALFEDYTIHGGQDNDDYNYNEGASLNFFLPFGKEPWEAAASEYPGGSKSNFGTVIPIKGYQTHQDANSTSFGAMRFIFTREQLVSGASGHFDLTKVQGTRFTWLNRNTDDDKRYHSFNIEANVEDDSNKHPHDIILDNFIAYTPYTNITIQNSTPSLVENDTDQQFVYQLQGGYVSGDYNYMTASNTYGLKKGLYDGKNDLFTKDIKTTVSIPANGSVTVKNIPFNSYYITQQNWSWRYRVNNITCNTNDIIKSYADGMNTASVLPRISFDGSGRRNVSILDLMLQRNFTVTFHNAISNGKFLSDETAVNNKFS